jgi:hypothetical protein
MKLRALRAPVAAFVMGAVLVYRHPDSPVALTVDAAPASQRVEAHLGARATMISHRVFAFTPEE